MVSISHWNFVKWIIYFDCSPNFFKTLLIYKFFTIMNDFLQVPIFHNTRFVQHVGIISFSLRKTFSTTNQFYISNVLFRYIWKKNHLDFKFLESYSAMSVLKKNITAWFLQLGFTNSGFMITLNCHRTCPWLWSAALFLRNSLKSNPL